MSQVAYLVLAAFLRKLVLTAELGRIAQSMFSFVSSSGAFRHVKLEIREIENKITQIYALGRSECKKIARNQTVL